MIMSNKTLGEISFKYHGKLSSEPKKDTGFWISAQDFAGMFHKTRDRVRKVTAWK